MRFGSTEIRDLFSLFPACAGVILAIASLTSPPYAVPRMRGGDPAKRIQNFLGTDCSPHARG